MDAVCNRDCFHCPHPDCIEDRITQAERRASMLRDSELKERTKVAAAQKAYREANREKVAAAQKAYYEANREKVAAAQKAYREANREKVAAAQKAYREANREKVAAAQKAYREANREKVAAAQKAYREANREKVAAAQGRELYDLRHEHGMTQTALGKFIGGISQSTISLWESGAVPFDLSVIRAKFSGVPAHE